MMTSSSLVVERAGGEQIVRRPRVTDAIGSALRDAYPCGGGLPEDILRLLRELDRPLRPH